MTKLYTRAAFAPATFDEESGTIEAIISTGAPVDRGAFVEQLDLDGASIEAGIPVLADHSQSAASVIGVVEGVRRENGALIAQIRFTDAPDAQPIIARILDGTLRGASMGYRVRQWREGQSNSGKRQRTAVAWQIIEVSAVAIPADPAAKFRSLDMAEIETPERPATTVTPEQRASYRAEVRQIAQRTGLTASWADTQIDAEADLDSVRASAIEEMQTRSTKTNIRVVSPAPGQDQDMQHRSEALFARMSGKAPSDEAKRFMGETLRDIATACVMRSGQSVGGMNPDQLFRAAAHSTADFSILLTSTANRVLTQSYLAALSPVRTQLSRQRLHSDFRPQSKIRIGGIDSLQKVAENGELKHTTRATEQETFALDTYGSIFSLTRQAMINDDLNALSDWAQVAGQSAAETESELLVSLLTSNAEIDDGTPLFDASHNNVAASGTAISVTSLSEARLAMRRQTGINGKPIAAAPAFLLVSPEQETQAEQVLAELNATTVAETNPFSGRLTLLVEPRLPAGAWYVFAQPGNMPVLEHAYLSSAQAPQISSREGFDVLGMEMRVVLDFGAGLNDYRGAFRNGGA